MLSRVMTVAALAVGCASAPAMAPSSEDASVRIDKDAGAAMEPPPVFDAGVAMEAGEEPSADAGSSTSAWLSTQGNHIYLGNKVWHGRGANLHDPRSCNACTGMPNAQEVNRRMDELVSWGASFIRLALESYSMSQSVLQDATYLAQIQSIVAHAAAKPGVYVLLSLWIDPTFTQLGWPSNPGTINVWKKLATTFAKEPRVLFGLVNEPQQNYDRALGKNIAYEVHVYDPQSSFPARFQNPSKTIPVIIGEFGPAEGFMTLADCQALWNSAKQLEIPYLAWTFHMRCPPNLLVDNSNNGCGVNMTLVEIMLEDTRVSRRHARVLVRGAEAILEDTGSRNGTWLNGARITRAALRDGDVIRVGHTLLIFRAGIPTQPSVPSDGRALEAMPGVATVLPWYATRLEALARVARAGPSVLLLGETGTGKEVLARAVHGLARPSGPFVAVNCGAIPSGLVESQLFGHVRGAFSSAVRDELGFMRAASGGTLFLDEIADLPRASQAALLRVLQEREVVPVGSARAVPVDVRVIAATHGDLTSLRPDLVARLSGFSFRLPPLRERREDLGVLVAQMLDRAVTFDLAAAEALFSHEWPHNVRELEHALSVALALAEGEIQLEHLQLAAAKSAPPPPIDEESLALRDELVRLLQKHHGNVSAVARELGRARPLVHRWLKRHGVDPAMYRAG